MSSTMIKKWASQFLELAIDLKGIIVLQHTLH
jgi:hypothetical protein